MMQDGGMNIMNHEKHTNILVNQANANPRQSTDHSRNLQHPFTSSVVLTHGERGVLRKNPRFFPNFGEPYEPNTINYSM